jgi:MYXO-CTERM domain-containing protein
VAHVEIYFNGYKWVDQPGSAFGTRGQPNPDNYAIRVPAELPDSIVDVKVIAYDDINASTESAVVTLTKGAACTTASTCAKGQKCEAGKCFWDPASGEIGASCSYPQFCKSGLCTGTQDEQICTQTCAIGVSDACPKGLTCQANSADPNLGVCFFETVGGGCCSVEGGSPTWWVNLGFAAGVLALVGRRRRR